MTEKPGAEIRRRLSAKGESQGWLSMHAHIEVSYLSKIIRGHKPITAETAIKLAKVLGETPEFWARLQADYDVAKAQREMAEA